MRSLQHRLLLSLLLLVLARLTGDVHPVINTSGAISIDTHAKGAGPDYASIVYS